MPLITDQAVCIRHWDWSETSQTVSLFTRQHGVIRGIAKGAKREKAAFSGGIEVMTRGEVGASLKNSDSLSTLTSWDLLETFNASRATLHGFFGGMAMLDVVQHSMGIGDPHPGLFDALVAGLRTMAMPGAERLAVSSVAWGALVETGHAPALDADVHTQEPLAHAAVYGFWPGLGGFSLQTLPAGVQSEPAMQTVWKVRAETVEYLRGLAVATRAPGADVIPALANDPNETSGRRCLQLLHAYFRFVHNVEAQALSQFVAMTSS